MRATPRTRHGSSLSPWLRRQSWRAFDLGAVVYAWFTGQDAWRAACRHLAAQLPARPGLLVLDLGCGPGVSAIEVARARPDVRVIGLDLAPRMLAQARRRVRTAGLSAGQVLLVRADAAHLPFRSGVVDAATGHSFLYLVPDRAATLAESRRVLGPGGRLVLMEPHARPARLRTVLGVSRDPRHLISVALWRPFSRLHGRFTAATLTATLEQAGFGGCRIEPVLGGLGLLVSAEQGAAPASAPRAEPRAAGAASPAP